MKENFDEPKMEVNLFEQGQLFQDSKDNVFRKMNMFEAEAVAASMGDNDVDVDYP